MWVLLLFLVGGGGGQMVVPGFRSKAACQAAVLELNKHVNAKTVCLRLVDEQIKPR